jgi:serine phosphatase RsbU (regulator of sigma subunit)
MPPAPQHEPLARTGEFEVTAAPAGAFLVVALKGRSTDDLLAVLQRQVFSPPKSLAVDAGALSGITMPLARSLYTAAQSLRAHGHALVLLNPPDSLRGFLKLLGADRRIPILLSETQLPAKAQEVDAVSDRLDRELQQFKREMETNALWQFADREHVWLCPFCGEFRDDVKTASRLTVGQVALERVWRHLHFECRAYVAGQPRYKGRAELEAKVRESNEVKLSASKGRVEALQSQVAKLEEKAQWATNLEKGVKIAASRQRKLLPTRAPTIQGCEIAHTYRPAEELSGDFYDFVELDGGKCAFVIGDVSGHGIEAGILMGMTKKVLSIRLSEIGDPVAALKKTNADIVKDMDRSSFVTIAVLVYDPATRSITCARAGHNPPLLYTPSKGKEVRKLEAGGLMLGMAQPARFDEQLVPETLPVQSGDILLLYTDGIEEGKNGKGEEFGIERMADVLHHESVKPGAYILGALFYEFDRFAAGEKQEDDLTAICIKFK